QRTDAAGLAAVAELHAEAAVGPEGVHVVGAEVHEAATGDAVVRDAVATVRVQVEVPRLPDAVGGVRGRRLDVGLRVVTPHVVGVGVDRPHALRLRVVGVVDLLDAPLVVLQRVHGAVLDVVQLDGARVLRLALAHVQGGVHRGPVGQDAAGGGGDVGDGP